MSDIWIGTATPIRSINPFFDEESTRTHMHMPGFAALTSVNFYRLGNGLPLEDRPAGQREWLAAA